MTRARYLKDPTVVLRVLLFHAANNGGLRETVTLLAASGIANLSAVALLFRMRTAEAWLCWICCKLCEAFRMSCFVPCGLRVRAVDSTSIQVPASKGTDYRIHYSLELRTMSCDWFEVTDSHGAELVERTPMLPGDVLMGDRNYLRPAALKAAVACRAYVLVRMRWSHSELIDSNADRFHALEHAKPLKVGEVGDWPVRMVLPDGSHAAGRVVAIRLPKDVAARAERRILRIAKKKHKTVKQQSLDACHFVMVFTTLPQQVLGGADALELYRFRWQVELAFKRFKSLLRADCLRHKEPRAVRTWLMGRLTLALLFKTLRRNGGAFFPGDSKSARCPASLRPASRRSRDTIHATKEAERLRGAESRQKLAPLSPWRCTAVIVHALVQALCPSPGLNELVAGICGGDLAHLLSDAPRARVPQYARVPTLTMAS